MSASKNRGEGEMSEHKQVKTTKMDYSRERPKAKNPLKIMDVTLRDGHQSLFAARGRTEDMIPIAEKMDAIGFWAVETWGGATFDTMHRLLNEDPWERIRTLKRYFKKTPFSMLLRAQNLVGDKNYADDLVGIFVERAAENGVDIFRIFDALNDYRNFEVVVPIIKKCGKHFQGCVCYTVIEPRLGGKVYNIDYYVNKAKDLEKIGADTICIKDVAGLIAPYDAYEVIEAIKKEVSVPVHLHSHCTSGMASMAHLKAIEAGVDILDTCLSPYAYRASHPAIEPLVMTLLGTNRDTGFDIKALAEIDEMLEKEIMPKYRHLLDDTKMSMIDINVLLHQTPGGMHSHFISQLSEVDALDKIDKVYEELPKVREDLGQIPLVLPMSQIVGIQTVNNVLFDDGNERYKMITDQAKDLCYGLYGKTAVPINQEIQKKALKGYERGEKPITSRPAKVLTPELEKAKKEIKGLAVDIDDEILYALYPVTGKKFLKWKYGKEEPPKEVLPKTLEEAKATLNLIEKAKAGKLVAKKEKEIPEKGEDLRTFKVFIDDDYFEIDVEAVGGPPVISYIQQPQAPAPQPQAPAPQPQAPAPQPQAPAPQPQAPKEKPKAEPTGDGTPMTSPMPGVIVDYRVKVGDKVNKGDILTILEAMKMENALPAPCSGTIKSINFSNGDSVAKGDVLCVIK